MGVSLSFSNNCQTSIFLKLKLLFYMIKNYLKVNYKKKSYQYTLKYDQTFI